MPDDSPTRAVRLWCHTCKALVPVLPTYINQAKGQPAVHHVTPAAWADHRAGHTS